MGALETTALVPVDAAEITGSSQCKVSSVTLMRRLSSNSRKNQGLQGVPGGRARDADRGAAAFPRRLGLRARVTAAPTRPRPTTGSPLGPRFGNQGVIAENDPAEQEGRSNGTRCCANLIVFHTAIDMMEVIRQLVAEGWQVTAEDRAQLSPYLTSHILRFGAYATDELHIPPDVFDPALDEVDFGGEQPAAA
jgi:hypothetical protein